MTAARLQQAIDHHRAGRLKEAREGYRAVLAEEPQNPDANNLLGIVCFQTRDYAEAVRLAETAIGARGDAPDYHNNLGLALKGLGKLDEAAVAFARAIALARKHGDALYNLGMLELDRRRYGDAYARLSECYRGAPEHAFVRDGLAIAAMRLDRLDEALKLIDEQFAQGRATKDSYNNKCVALTLNAAFAAARSAVEEGLARFPHSGDLHLNRAHLLLMMGELREGFGEMEWRLRRKEYGQKFSMPRWQGEALPGGTIQIWCEQGFGDALQFIRYMPLVKARVGTVKVKCKPELRKLFATVPGIDEVIMPRSAHRFDVHAPIMSLPFIFATEEATIPAGVPYIPAPSARPLDMPAGLRKVGLVWAGNPLHARDRSRSRPLSEFAALAGTEGVSFVNLQYGEAGQEAPPAGLKLADPGEIGDFNDTAAVLAGLDLLIAVDTAPAHLAGAMGVPVWLIVDKVPDWRWMLDRTDTPWYPTMRLYRSEGDYAALFRHLAEDLAAFAKT
jgi:Flp pilus assembly protein TadD